MFAIGEIGDAAAIPTLIQWARRSEVQCRVAAVQVLGRFSDERCVAVLKSLASNEAKLLRSEGRDVDAEGEWAVAHAARTALSALTTKRWWQFWR
ncbi:MAG: HEAT repeat domain-containing protein [Planctomycetes bacterium]|nr:HEAT repeat domain-containing protein [Planctomycetota bacterium]